MNSKELAKSYISFMVNIANADGDFCEDELSRIEGGSIQFLKLQGLNIEDTLVVECIKSPYSMDRLNSVFKELQAEHKLGILTQALCLAYADGEYHPEEKALIENFIENSFPTEQTSMVKSYLEAKATVMSIEDKIGIFQSTQSVGENYGS